ncbi:H-NS family nucleoid-associated regulatory protein [Stenoxybacter acetivorans]|uniref:H-NS histone family protein n=1 Tax=Stenoxybacter acetivorans TaxID=422441 RepID=UPI00056D054D|nr:H-NS histone family protein [Stenoxybacter acetivorans]
MDINLTHDLAELEKEKARLEVYIERIKRKERSRVKADIARAMKSFEISFEELRETYDNVDAEPQSRAKYQNPLTGQTWSGAGKRPKWVVDHLEAGKSLDELLIEK